ncbi:MAG: exodeoxyribonuclease III [Deltaproteobacteria bacterium]|nr:exodeoxyribonuclease III [Deltaproteobacteria bacterium]MCB9478620.1 exodeoxyribonuclease III [Deltaproteobacteria bacterium]MCB9490114.1 exodeoxyribonuclease III [Deltaproteobacteria bacterium]
MDVYSYNVNGIRACVKKGFRDWMTEAKPTIVGLQEVRSPVDQVPEDLHGFDGFAHHFVAAEKKGYSGVGLLAAMEPDEVVTTMGEERFDVEGRFQLARFGKLTIVNVYVPNGTGPNRDLSRIPYKLDFTKRLFDILEAERSKGGRILVMGDYNTAHREIDIARPKANVKNSGFRPEEREEMDRILALGWTDTFRHFEKGPDHYTWWSQRFGVREKNIGWRIDYIMASPGAMKFVKGAAIHPMVMCSDHCPISVRLDDKVLK